MPRSVHPALRDIIDAIDGIERAVSGKTFADYEAEWLLQRGVERAIEIISEASRRIPPDLTALGLTFLGGTLQPSEISCAMSINRFPAGSFGTSSKKI